MSVGVLRYAALALSVALGLGAGAGAAYVVDRTDRTDGAADPLGLGIELVNQRCTGESIIILGRGSTRVGLRPAAVEYAHEAKYLDVDASCPALYAPLDAPAPEYVVYLGPFADHGAVCARKMTVEHRGDPATSLSPGNQTYVRCPCELSADDWPVLTPDMGRPDPFEGMWIHQLQSMLVDIGRLVDDVDESGVYDARTVAVVRRIQDYYLLEPDGVVDTETWEAIRDRACRSYEDY